MHTYHIHINGLVQGVGFRPFVYKLAKQYGISGYVNNSNDGVHIEFSADEITADNFYKTIFTDLPQNAIITQHDFKKIEPKAFSDFSITQSDNQRKPSLLLTTDIAICPVCKNELTNQQDRRFQYPFITCLHCGPRYSIISSLPYDRENTTMSHLEMCETCTDEYNNVYDRRHYSQTNSCKDCAITMHLYESKNNCSSSNTETLLKRIHEFLTQGKILAVKGIGGYLLLCDATNEKAISTLRSRKHRPSKPFALLFFGFFLFLNVC